MNETAHDSLSRRWRVLLHLSVMAGLVAPVLGFIAPIVIWQLKQDEFPKLRPHAYVVLNWILSALIYAGICMALNFTIIGMIVGVPGMVAIAVMTIAFTVVGAMKANDGEVWEYPLSIRFFS